MENIKFRFAKKEDIKLILGFIKELAIYEKMLDEVVADEKTLEDLLFNKQRAEVIFPVIDDVEIGFALFFYNFSTFVGKSGLYLEDLYIKKEYRGKGYGKALIKELANIAIKRDCGRFEWTCLNWNTPSINFYLSIGAKPMSDWTIYRLDGENLKKLAK